MYKVLINDYSNIPVVVNTNSDLYADYLLTGNYTEYFSGTMKQCYDVERELQENTIELETW